MNTGQSKTEAPEGTTYEIVWCGREEGEIETSGQHDSHDEASSALLQKMLRSDRGLQHGDYFETAEYGP